MLRPIPSSFSVGGVSGVSSVVFPFFVINILFYLFAGFPELLDSSYVQQFSMFQVDKDNVTMNIDGFQAFKQLAADIQYQYWWISNPSKYCGWISIQIAGFPPCPKAQHLSIGSRGSDEREIAAVDRCAVLYDLLASEVELGDGPQNMENSYYHMDVSEHGGFSPQIIH